MNILNLSSRSITIELINNDPYYNKNTYDIYLNNTYLYSDNLNVFTLYDLLPDTNYKLDILDKTLEFKTLKENKVLHTSDFNCYKDGIHDDTVKLQACIMCCNDNDTIIVDEGKYFITSLYFKSNITFIFNNAYFIADVNRMNFPIHPDYASGIWEGSEVNNFASIFNFINVSNVTLLGNLTLDCNSLNGDWYKNHRVMNIAWRGHAIFTNNSNNISLIGLSIKDTQSWAVHPYNSSNIYLYNLKINNTKSMPTTDGIDPDMCDKVIIKGCTFDVGDDCIAIKSGTYDLAKKYKKPCSNIIIENNLMMHGHGGVVFGSESSGGICNVVVQKCIFIDTDRGLRIKTRRGRGNINSINNVTFNNIIMDNVLTPFVINSYYNMGPKGGHTEYVWTKEKLSVDEYTPVLGKFKFSNMVCNNVEYAAGVFLGLPEMPIEEVYLENIQFNYKENAEEGIPAMMEFPYKMKKQGIYILNVKNIKLENVTFNGSENELVRED